MNPIAPVLAKLAASIAARSAECGDRVDVEAMRVTDRSDEISLTLPGEVSPNGACRMFRTVDGWIAVNLAREEDRELVPAWLEREVDEDFTNAIIEHARRRSCETLLTTAHLLGLPIAGVGEVKCKALEVPLLRVSGGPKSQIRHAPKVVDLSALWAGPLCGAVLAEMGGRVIKIEDVRRPDSMRFGMPEFHWRLNGKKSELRLDFSHPRDRARLHDEILSSQILITSARPRAFEGLGLSPQAVFAANPSLVWVAITGYGWTGESGNRVAFGDDAAAAGGLVRWTSEGVPHFLGDALSDPITGAAAAVGALSGLISGGGVLVDAAMARLAAAAATMIGHAEAA